MKLISIFLSLFMFSLNAYATPKAVIIIRHAEKINDESTGLSELGKKRAEYLVHFVNSNTELKNLGSISHIFAASPKHETSSLRSIQTAAPLEKSLNIKMNIDYTKDQVGKLSKEVLTNPKFNNKVIFIVWAHAKIAKLAEKLGADTAPKEWDDQDYDHVWILKYNGNNFEHFFEINQTFQH